MPGTPAGGRAGRAARLAADACGVTQVHRLSSLLEQQTATVAAEASRQQQDSEASQRGQLKLAETALLLRDELALARHEFEAALQAAAPAGSSSPFPAAQPKGAGAEQPAAGQQGGGSGAQPAAAHERSPPAPGSPGGAAANALAQSIREAFAAEGAALSTATLVQLVAACSTQPGTPPVLQDAAAARGVSHRSLKIFSVPAAPAAGTGQPDAGTVQPDASPAGRPVRPPPAARPCPRASKEPSPHTAVHRPPRSSLGSVLQSASQPRKPRKAVAPRSGKGMLRRKPAPLLPRRARPPEPAQPAAARPEAGLVAGEEPPAPQPECSSQPELGFATVQRSTAELQAALQPKLAAARPAAGQGGASSDHAADAGQEQPAATGERRKPAAGPAPGSQEQRAQLASCAAAEGMSSAAPATSKPCTARTGTPQVSLQPVAA